ncbi:MAG: hypothetical protein PHE09_19055, partial [Oscillospiraceae bacterium]|nr:hypothetical protein [Oscillospiraceae bacterium]
SKVSQTELNSTVSTAIRQSPNDVVFAFNNQSSSQSLKLDGNGAYFYSNGSGIGHMGVTYNSALGQYGICIQPAGGHGSYFMPDSDYALMCLGRIKAQELAADGMISTPGRVVCGSLTVNGESNWSGSIGPLMKADGGTVTLNFGDGIMTGWS